MLIITFHTHTPTPPRLQRSICPQVVEACDKRATSVCEDLNCRAFLSRTLSFWNGALFREIYNLWEELLLPVCCCCSQSFEAAQLSGFLGPATALKLHISTNSSGARKTRPNPQSNTKQGFLGINISAHQNISQE